MQSPSFYLKKLPVKPRTHNDNRIKAIIAKEPVIHSKSEIAKHFDVPPVTLSAVLKTLHGNELSSFGQAWDRGVTLTLIY